MPNKKFFVSFENFEYGLVVVLYVGDLPVVVVARLLADRAHEVGRLGVGRHVSAERRPSPEALVAVVAGKVALAGVDDDVGRQVELVAKHLVAVLARVGGLSSAPRPSLLLAVLADAAGGQRVDGGNVRRGVVRISVGLVLVQSSIGIKGGPSLLAG